VHILFLTDNFPPEVNAPASRTFEHCREWVKAGHKVTVVTCAPNFPTGKVFDGYRNRLFSRETMDGIDVVRVWSYITANEGFLRRTLDYVSFMMMATPASLCVRGPDIIIATSPQFFTACAGYLVSRLRRVPYIFELRDLWPESIHAVGALNRSFVFNWLERLELFLYHKAEVVVAVTNAFKDNLQARGIDASKVAVVTNGADLARFQPLPKDASLVEELGLKGRFVAGYIGTHGLAHKLETLVNTARLLRDGGHHDIHFLFLGDGAAKAALKTRAQQMELRNVTFIDSVPKAEVIRYWSLLDASIIHVRKTDLFASVIPSKLFECMAMGIPVLHGVRGESAGIVEAERAGFTFEPENSAELRDRILELVDNRELTAALGANGLAASRKFDRRHLAARMLHVIESCAPGKPGTQSETNERA
jgi:hypothetical protein